MNDAQCPDMNADAARPDASPHLHARVVKPNLFYERLATSTPLKLIASPARAKLIVSVTLGLIIFGFQWLALQSHIFENWGWMLGPLISFATLFLYYATDVFQQALVQIEVRWPKDHRNVLKTYVDRIFKDSAFKVSGIVFGVVNTALGWLFGLPQGYDSLFAKLTTCVGFFVVGFMCGLAVWGVVAVWRAISQFGRNENVKVDFSAPDECGGMDFVGKALAKFASVTLVMGVLIAWYILHMQWLNRHSQWVEALMWFWVLWPFIVSAFVYCAPGFTVHQTLAEAKQRESDRLQKLINDIETQIDSPNASPSEQLLKKHEHYRERRAVVYKMRTWPYNLESRIHFVGILIANALVTVKEMDDHWPGIIVLFKHVHKQVA